MPNEFRWLAPVPQPNPEVLVAYALTRQFYREVEQRQEFERYCQWYYETAEAHQRELQSMRRDINLFGWFCRRHR